MRVLITGATAGIGYKIAEKALEEGHQVSITGRKTKTVEPAVNMLQSKYGAKVEGFIVDFTKANETQQFIDSAFTAQTLPDVLIFNAGQYAEGPMHELGDGHIEPQLRLHFLHIIEALQVWLPWMKARKGGHIICMNSIISLEPRRSAPGYSVSKAALLAYLRALQPELIPYGIRVSQLLPSSTQSRSWQGSGIQEDQLMDAEELAKWVSTMWSSPSNMVSTELILRPMSPLF